MAHKGPQPRIMPGTGVSWCKKIDWKEWEILFRAPIPQETRDAVELAIIGMEHDQQSTEKGIKAPEMIKRLKKARKEMKRGDPISDPEVERQLILACRNTGNPLRDIDDMLRDLEPDRRSDVTVRHDEEPEGRCIRKIYNEFEKIGLPVKIAGASQENPTPTCFEKFLYKYVVDQTDMHDDSRSRVRRVLMIRDKK